MLTRFFAKRIVLKQDDISPNIHRAIIISIMISCKLVDTERSLWNYRASLRGCDSLISVAMGKLTVPVH